MKRFWAAANAVEREEGWGVELDGKPYGEFPVVALEPVPLAGILGRGWDSIRLMFTK